MSGPGDARRTVGVVVERAADRVTVPEVVGLPFHIARDVAWEAGVTLANPDPDGPPIGALAWPGLFYVTSQSPAAGSVLYRWDSVAVEVVAHGEADSGAMTEPSDVPPADLAHAEPEGDSFVDLTRNGPPSEKDGPHAI